MVTLSHVNIIDAGDVLIVGAGLAGLFTALKLSPRPVTILAAGKRSEGTASKWAQGGIAAALGGGDHPDFHAHDTIKAGAGLVDPQIAQLLADEAAARIDDLIGFGVVFDRHDDTSLRLGREAAHSHNRIVSVQGDRSGHAIMATLGQRVAQTPTIGFLEGYAAYELAIEEGRVVGVFARPASKTNLNGAFFIRARATILAMGGAGHLYQVTTNPRGANGEAIAMAARAGAQIADAEFVQFHPTAITGMGDPAPLATEALRGEGAILLDAHGHRFMLDVHEDGELAPRDIVAREVFHAITETGGVGLDLRPSGLAAQLASRFPSVFASCIKAGLDPTRQPVPVAPAMHFHMGGIRTDARGRTDLPGLWACGEIASTGVHGANRLASNSLLEAVVFATRIAVDVSHNVPDITALKGSKTNIPKTSFSPEPLNFESLSPESPSFESKIIAPAITQLRELMTRHVGVLRNREGLTHALHELRRLERAAAGFAPFANIVLAAQFITMSALQRCESRGAHFRTDHPHKNAQTLHTLITLANLREAYHELPADQLRRPDTLSYHTPTHHTGIASSKSLLASRRSARRLTN